MDSLTRDVERIFNQNWEENEDTEKSVVYRMIEYAFDVIALLMIYVALALFFCMAAVLLGKTGKVFFKDRKKRKKCN